MKKTFCIELINDDVNQALNKWIDYIRSEKRSSVHTIDAYYRDVDAFITFLLEHIGGPISIKNINTVNIC